MEVFNSTEVIRRNILVSRGQVNNIVVNIYDEDAGEEEGVYGQMFCVNSRKAVTLKK